MANENSLKLATSTNMSSFSFISDKDMTNLENKRMIHKNLQNFTKTKKDYLLTKKEKKYLNDNPIIKFAILKKWKGFSYINEENELVGFHIDLLKQINKNLNTNIKTNTFNSWTEAYESAKEGLSDGILGLSWSIKREQYFSYSPSYHYMPYHIIVRQDDDNTKKIESFSNKIVIILKNDITNAIIKRRTPNTKIINAKEKEEILIALRNKTADASLIVDISQNELTKYHLKISKTVFIKEGELSIGIKKNKKTLISIIKKGINSITKEKMKELKQKWFDKGKEKSIFTNKELIYIRNSPVLIVGVEDIKPFIFTHDNIKMEGLAGEILEKAFKISGLKIKLVDNTWKKLLDDFKKGKIDILPTAYYTDERTKYGLYTERYLTSKEFLYVKSNNMDIHSFNDLKGKKIAIVKSYGTIPLIKEKFPDITIKETSSLEESISAVLNTEVEALFSSQIAIEDKLRELLITNLKAISQTSIKVNGIHMLSKKDDLILQGILQKSLFSIPTQEKNSIIAKWLTPVRNRKKVNIAFGKNREPYAFNKNYLKGIEHDIVKYVLHKSNISINRKTYLSLDEMNTALEKDDTLDIAVTVKQEKNQFYYSNNFINFENAVISRIEDNIYVDSIKDLRSKKIIAFSGAYKFLGDEFKQMFNPENKNKYYTEQVFQEKQVQEFLDKKTDIIILDVNIFKWFLKKLSSNPVSNFKFDFILPNKNTFKVAFKDKTLRDIFNINLEAVKQSGQYQKIINDYIESDIEAKVKINSLISSLVSKYIFEENSERLKEIISIFLSLDYIKKIEVFDNNSKALLLTSDKKLSQFSQHDSFYIFSNIPRKSGFIRVFFDEEKLKKASSNNNLIPELIRFEKLDSYNYVKKTYKIFDYMSKKFNLSKKEKKFILDHPRISYSSLNREPMSIVENNKLTGLMAEYIKIIEEKTGLNFVFEKSESRDELNNKFRNKQIDLFPKVRNSNKVTIETLVSKEISSFHFAIITDREGSFADKISDLSNKTLALAKDSPSYHFLKSKFPNIKIIETKNIKEALSLISQGKAYAFVGQTEVAIYHIKKYFPDLKIAGITDNKQIYHFLIQKEYPELLSIINKILVNISLHEKQNIRDKWISEKISTAINYTLIYQIMIVFILILLIILIFMKKLSTAKTKIEQTNDKLEYSNKTLKKTILNLKQTQEQLLASEKMAALGGLVAGVAHELNTPVGVGLTGISHLEDSTKNILVKHKNNNLSLEEFEEYLSISNSLSSLIHKNMKRAAQLVMSFKQVAVDQSSEEKRIFNLNDYMYEILESIHSLTKKTQLKIKLKCSKNININSYPGAYSQVISNLIMNSIIHGFKKNEKGNILINIKKQNETITLIFEDDGKGISKENLPKIFDPFFTTKRNTGGSGLGLNIIYNIVTSTLNGTISCESEENKGTKFIITLTI
ncbi:MAG: transporter substrate-binding domain-containing protein [Pseudomonadota bacterium]